MSAGSGIRPLARELYRARIRVRQKVDIPVHSAIPVIAIDLHMDFMTGSRAWRADQINEDMGNAYSGSIVNLQLSEPLDVGERGAMVVVIFCWP